MTPEYERNKLLAQYMERQHPQQWTSGRWYPAHLPDGREVEIRRSNGRGKQTGSRYLHIKLPVTVAIKTITGHVLNHRLEHTFYRINMQSFYIDFIQ